MNLKLQNSLYIIEIYTNFVKILNLKIIKFVVALNCWCFLIGKLITLLGNSYCIFKHIFNSKINLLSEFL